MSGIAYLGQGQIQALRPRVTFTLAYLWKLERRDGVVQRFASHDKVIRFRNEDYRPLGPTPSDIEQSEGAAESDLEAFGFLSAHTIRASDIHAGRYDGCTVTLWCVDWMRPWKWFRKNVWWVKDLRESGGMFHATLQGPERFLTIPVGQRYERECDLTFGSDRCGAAPIVQFGAVVQSIATTGAPIQGLVHGTRAFSITAASWATPPRDGLVSQGKVVWTSGPNQGTEQVVGIHVGRQLVLMTEAPFGIHAGDVCAIYSGCDGTRRTCIDDYANGDNHGGISHMPSTSDTYKKPVEA